MSVVKLNPEHIPKSKRIKIGKKYITLSQPKIQIPIEWDMSEHPLFLQFIGYWLGKGRYEKFGVSISTGKDTQDLINIFDYIAELFKCNYRIRDNKVVRFDSAMLKYTMMGLQLDTLKSVRDSPPWISRFLLSKDECIEILRGYITARGKINRKSCSIFLSAPKSIYRQMRLGSLLAVIDVRYVIVILKNNEIIKIQNAQDIEKFYMDIGFLSSQKNQELYELLYSYA